MSTNSDQTPTFNLKVVVQETGLKPDTLRAWERRYGLPQPNRSGGGHRLYSQRDIDTLKWLMARQNEGLSISRAVELWQRLIGEGENPLAAEAADQAATPPFVPSGEVISEFRQAWIDACMNFDEKQAQEILAQASAVFPAEVVCFEILQKGLADVGQMWAEGKATVQQEHFTSALAMRHLEAMIAASPPPTRSQQILIGCPPEELHTFSLLLIALLLRRQGWRVTYLGARVPTSYIKETIDAIRPDLIILGAQQLFTATTLLDIAHHLRETQTLMAYGGRVFNRIPRLVDVIPGYFLGDDLTQIALQVEQLLAGNMTLTETRSAPDRYLQALDHYHEKQGFIEAELWNSMQALGVTDVILAYWNLTVARNLGAALTLGDMGLLDLNLDWAKELVISYNLPESLLRQYLSLYQQALTVHLDDRGQPLLAWFSQLS